MRNEYSNTSNCTDGTVKFSPIRVAICGIRGIPACYGGFETFAEEISTRLVKRGHSVVVYGRKHVIDYPQEFFNGVEIRLLRAPKHKYLETPVHTLFCLLDLIRRPVDVVLVCNAANSPFLWFPRLFRLPIVLNVDGIERQRKKWNVLGRWWYRLGELGAVLFPNVVVSDAEVIRDYYKTRYRIDSNVIPYGHNEIETGRFEAKIEGDFDSALSGYNRAVLEELGLRAGEYILYVSRLEPENNAHVVIEAYNSLNEEQKKIPLVIVGDAPYAQDYIAGLRRAAGPNIHFAGYRFNEHYKTLQLGAKLYIQATEVGGTHPALVEAMGFGNCIIANGTPENIEVLAEGGSFYDKNDRLQLAQQISRMLADAELLNSYRKKAYRRAKATYVWDKIVSDYERLFASLKR